MGKVNTLQLFLTDLKTRAKTYCWDHPTHGILTVAVDGTNYNLLEDYGKITEPQVQATWMACNAADASPQAKQNSRMMYECLMASITEEVKSALTSRDQDFHENGLTLFYHVVSKLFTATFSNAQATHDNLSDFHPKRFKYDIIQVNNYISSAVMTLKAASLAGGTITNQVVLQSGDLVLPVQGVQEDQGPGRVDYPHPSFGVHSGQHPWLHSRNSLQ